MTDKKTISLLSDIHEVAVYLARIGARPRSFKDAVVEKITGGGKYYKEVATIRFEEDGTVTAPAGFMPTDGEQEVIKAAFEKYEFPHHVCVDALVDLPDEVKRSRPEDIYIFKNERGQIEMLQQRIDTVEGKDYKPWTFWSDNKWRRIEHGGLLPLWGLEQLKENSIIFLHEGVKAARAVLEMIKSPKAASEANFPWYDEFKDAAHLGWIGGANNSHRTNWSILGKNKGIKRCYIISDNDDEGRHAVPKIAQQLNFPTFTLQFSNDWPDGFDLADPFPPELFSDAGFYNGPCFRSMLHPATYATDTISIPPASGKGRPQIIHKMRPEFAKQWCWIEDIDRYVCVEFPHVILKKDTFNARHLAFSKAADLSKLLHQYYLGRNIKLTYRPDNEFKFTTDDEASALNLYRPSNVKAYKGMDSSADEFLEFLNYLVPRDEDNLQMQRWIATIIARPKYRILYGILMRSEVQGVGKTLLSDHILAPIIGKHNCAWPNENMIIGQPFNGWLANKRLIIVNEIYAGHNWQAYNKLKTFITDDDIEVNIKHMATYTIPNWAHFFMCSNSLVPLKVDETDRRIFVPEVTESPWTLEKFTKFRAWLTSGGLQKIVTWAHSFDKSGDRTYIRPGEIAPMSVSKQQVIEESRSDVENMAIQLAEVMADFAEKGVDVVIAQSDIKQYMLEAFNGRVYEGERKIANVMKRTKKVFTSEEQFFIKGRKYRLLANKEELLKNPDREYLIKVRKHPRDLMPDSF